MALQATGEGAEVSGAVSDLRAVMRLLARLTSAEPGLAVTLVQMPVQSDADKAEERRRPQDLLTLVAAVMSQLSQLFAAPLEGHADGLSLLGGLPLCHSNIITSLASMRHVMAADKYLLACAETLCNRRDGGTSHKCARLEVMRCAAECSCVCRLLLLA